MYSELNRKIANLIKQGTVAEVDVAKGRVRVKHGELVSEWLPYFVPAAGGVSVHRPPSVGENCIILSPSGETAAGMVLCGMASQAHSQPSYSADETVVKFPDGAVAKYNHASSAMQITGIKTGQVVAAQSITLDTPDVVCTGNLTVNKKTTSQGLLTYQSGMSGANGNGGQTVIDGDFEHHGSFDNTGSIRSNGIVLDTHTHPGDSGGTTGAPK